MTAALLENAPRTDLVKSADVELYFRVFHQVELKAATVRQWASRGRIATHGFGQGSKRARYSLREVVAFAKAQGIV